MFVSKLPIIDNIIDAEVIERQKKATVMAILALFFFILIFVCLHMVMLFKLIIGFSNYFVTTGKTITVVSDGYTNF